MAVLVVVAVTALAIVTEPLLVEPVTGKVVLASLKLVCPSAKATGTVVPVQAASAVRFKVSTGLTVAGKATGVGDRAKISTLIWSVNESPSSSTGVAIEALKADGTLSVWET